MRFGVLVLAACALFGLAGQANATAMVHVRAEWSAQLYYYSDQSGLYSSLYPATPTDVGVSCFGNANDIYRGCGYSLTVDAVSHGGSLETTSSTANGGLYIENNSQQTYSFDFITNFSAFNPGGPSIGAQVDDPLHEFAGFSSLVSGPGVYDSHACTTDASHASCGVMSPDSSQYEFGFTLAPGQTYTATYLIDIESTVQSVPEPTSLVLLAGSLLGLGLLRRRRAV